MKANSAGKALSNNYLRFWNMFYYRPAVSEKDFLREQTKKFLEKMYEGNAKNLVASMIEQDYIHPGDVEELKSFWEGGESRK